MVISQFFPSLLSNIMLIFKCILKTKKFWFDFISIEMKKLQLKLERTNTNKSKKAELKLHFIYIAEDVRPTCHLKEHQLLILTVPWVEDGFLPLEGPHPAQNECQYTRE